LRRSGKRVLEPESAILRQAYPCIDVDDAIEIAERMDIEAKGARPRSLYPKQPT